MWRFRAFHNANQTIPSHVYKECAKVYNYLHNRTSEEINDLCSRDFLETNSNDFL